MRTKTQNSKKKRTRLRDTLRKTPRIALKADVTITNADRFGISKGNVTILGESEFASRQTMFGSDAYQNPFDIISVSHKGISYDKFSLIQHKTPFSEKEWLDFLNITKRTLQRYKEDNRIFDRDSTEKVILINRLLLFGHDVFEDKNKFEIWLSTPNLMFNSKSPRQLLDTTTGIQLVEEELRRIEYGVFA